MTTITKVTPKLLATVHRQIKTLSDVAREFEEAAATGIENHSRLIDATQVAISELTDALQDHLPEAKEKLRESLAVGGDATLPPTLTQAILEALEE